MNEKLKTKIKKLNFKKTVRLFTLFWGLILIIVMTITNIGFDKSFDFIKWLSNALILAGIMVFGLVMGESLGLDTQKERIGGLYQNNLIEYNKLLASLNDIIVYFIQFYQWFIPIRVRNKKLEHLLGCGMLKSKAELIIDYCTIEDLRDLEQHAIKKTTDSGEEVIIRKLQAHEVEPTRQVLSGEVKLNFVKASYYLSAFGDSKTRDITEEGVYIDKEIAFSRKSTRAFKITTSLLVSLAWGILTVQEMMSGDDTQAWFNLISRITALFTSILSGWMSGANEVKLRARKIKNKIIMLTIFKNSLDKKIFIPESENELAKKEYEEYLKEQEEALKNVVVPDEVKRIENTEQQEESTTENPVDPNPTDDKQIRQIAESNMFKDFEVDITKLED